MVFSSTQQYGGTLWPPFQHHRAYNYDVFGVRLPAADATLSPTPQVQLESEGLLLEPTPASDHHREPEMLGGHYS